jgi:hypothetical protein
MIDDKKLSEAEKVRGTRGIKATIDAALDEVLRREAIQRTIDDLAALDRDALHNAWR